MSLRIEPIATDKTHQHPKVPHKVMPQHEFTMLIVAPKGSGKTNLICNLIMKHYKGYFHRILVISPTVDNDAKWDVVKKTRGILAENKVLKRALGDGLAKGVAKKLPKVVHKDEQHVDEDNGDTPKFTGKMDPEDFFGDMTLLPERMKLQNEKTEKLRELGYGDKSKFMTDRMLIILDDQAGLFKGGNVNNPMINFWFKIRHYNCSGILVTQANKAVPKSLRTNCNSLICFELPNQAELKTVYEEWPEGMNEEEWLDAYHFATKEPYSFLYINNHFPKGHRVYKNFEFQIVKAEHAESLKRKKTTDKDEDSSSSSSDEDDDDDDE